MTVRVSSWINKRKEKTESRKLLMAEKGGDDVLTKYPYARARSGAAVKTRNKSTRDCRAVPANVQSLIHSRTIDTFL
jgi:hypothetical protein